MSRQGSPIPPRASAAYQGVTTQQLPQSPGTTTEQLSQKGNGYLTPLGCGALLVVGCLCVWSFVIVPLNTYLTTQWHYGDAHITRISADIGRGREDFFAYDANGSVVVLEVNPAHPEKTRMYTGIELPHDSGNTIITLAVSDVEHNGKLDVIVSVGQEKYVLFNTGNGLSWSQH
ncbi:MAG: hypothetical protein JO202_16825 [Ktedonobacteraceae bacterium]|nr:hypothetical protein [Ktedonobacteraceae bacterium]